MVGGRVRGLKGGPENVESSDKGGSDQRQASNCYMGKERKARWYI